MSSVKGALVAIGVALVAAIAAGGVGAVVALVLSFQFFEGRIDRDTFEGLTVYSQAFGEARKLRVHLPVGYDEASDVRYPLLLVLDGGSQDGHTNRSADVLARVGVGGPMIVVGIPAGDRGRSVDFLPPGEAYGRFRGRADEFLEFVESDAIPAIESRYRTEPGPLIAGWSQGGLFVTYSLIHRPEIFGARFALSPTWTVGEQAIVAELEEFLVGHAGLESFFYMSLGTLESASMHEAFEAGRSVLERSAPPGLVWRADLTPGADHIDNPVLSTAWALEAFWEYRNGDGTRHGSLVPVGFEPTGR